MMKISPRKIFKFFSILSYCCIMLKGQFMVFPFIWFILFTIYGSEGSQVEFASIAGLTGLLLLLYLLQFKKTKYILLIELGVFILLCAPLIQRLVSVPIELFNYPLFVIPVISFVTFYFLLLIFGFKELNNPSL